MAKVTKKARPVKTKADEVPDEALDRVAGGFNPQPDPPGKVARPVIVDPVARPINAVRPGG